MELPRWAPTPSPSRPILSQASPSIPETGSTTGVLLTWKDVWVSVPVAGSGNRGILQGATGYALPGEVLAIMGPSGSGKSTLLDALAGHLEGATGFAKPGEVLAIMAPSGSGKSSILDALAGRLSLSAKHTGEILINGRKQALSYGTSAYVTQDDTLMSTLTVQEAVWYSAQLQLPTAMTKSAKKQRADKVISEMGLREVATTRIGGWSRKGISGGQKRRVSICLELLTRPKLLFLDEPTSGLDSAAAHHVMARIINLARTEKMTVVASIHQPSSEVFELFRNLCLLASGKLVYFGPTSGANELFSKCGFPCPSTRYPSDHYLRIINDDFENEDVEVVCEEAVNTLVKAYRSSATFDQVEGRVNSMFQQEGDEVREKRGNEASTITQSVVLIRRSFVNMHRDIGYYWLRLAIYIALSLALGSIFYDIGHSYNSIQARGSALMFVATFMTFMAVGGLPSFVEEAKVFRRERLNGHYGASPYILASTLSSIPYLFAISFVPSVIAYFLIGLQRSFDHFFYFALLLFTSMLVVESQMVLSTNIVPDFLMGLVTVVGIQGVMILTGGFFRLPNDLPRPFWKYPMYYVSFHKYAFQGFFKNEFQGLSFPNMGGSGTISGDEILRTVWQMEMGYSKWVDLAILFGMVVAYRILFLLILKAAEKVRSNHNMFRCGKF